MKFDEKYIEKIQLIIKYFFKKQQKKLKKSKNFKFKKLPIFFSLSYNIIQT